MIMLEYLRGTKRDEVERGQVLSPAGSAPPHTKFECEVYVLSKDEEDIRHFLITTVLSFTFAQRCDWFCRITSGYRNGNA